MKRKLAYSMLNLLMVLMALSLAVLIPSGALTEDARMRYEALQEPAQSPDDEEESYDRSAVQPVAVLASAAMSDILPAANIDPLPLDLTAPGNAPIEANYTDSGYRDESIIVSLEQLREYDSDVFVAYVKIATPSQIRTAIAGTKLSSTRTNHTTTICDNYNGIVAINGDFYSDPNVSGGYIVRQCEVYREKASANLDLLVIDELGDFHILPRGKESQQNSLDAIKSAHQIVNCFFFGPALVVDGVQAEMPEKYAFAPGAKNPRAGIAQLDVLTSALVVVNGRTDASAGVTMEEFASIMTKIGAKQAYNLDGGNSATLAFRGQVYNDKPQDERAVADIVYFASAAGQE